MQMKTVLFIMISSLILIALGCTVSKTGKGPEDENLLCPSGQCWDGNSGCRSIGNERTNCVGGGGCTRVSSEPECRDSPTCYVACAGQPI